MPQHKSGQRSGLLALATGGALLGAPLFVSPVAREAAQTIHPQLPLRGGGCELRAAVSGTTAICSAVITAAALHAAASSRSRKISRCAEEASAEATAPEPVQAPESAAAASTAAATGFAAAKQLGAIEPLGFWDPANFVKDDKDKFFKYRVAEIKHGRVAMMAALGAVFQHFVTFPGFDDVPRGITATDSNEGFLGALALLGLSGYLETVLWKQDSSKEAGNFGDPARLNQYTDEMRNRELSNGRFAMVAVLGQIVAENETGKDAVEQLLGI